MSSANNNIVFDSWPNNCKVCVVPVVNVEVFLPGKGGPAIQPHLQSNPEIANAGWRDYGNRAGCARLERVFCELDIPVTAVVNSDVVEREPAVFQSLLDAKWEIGAHGVNNSTGLANLSPEEEAKAIEQSLSTLEKAAGARPTTWLTPGFSVTKNTPSLLKKAGVSCLLDFTNEDVPFTHNTDNGPITCLPYSMETNDISLCLTAKHDPKQYADILVASVTQLADEGRVGGRPTVVCFGLHTFLAGTPARAHHLSAALSAIKRIPGVWFATAAQATAHLASVAPPESVPRPLAHIPLVVGTHENLAPYGEMIGTDVKQSGLGIPFYATVIEGKNFPQFTLYGQPTCRTAQILPKQSRAVNWLERHMRMTQMFVGLGDAPFLMVLGAPTQDRQDLSEEGRMRPDMSNVKAFVIPPGHGLLIHIGTWHDFPVALTKPVTCLTFNSAEVVEALASMKSAAEMDHGDVFKLRLQKHFHTDFHTADWNDPQHKSALIAAGIPM